jgi:hypothetical protein
MGLRGNSFVLIKDVEGRLDCETSWDLKNVSKFLGLSNVLFLKCFFCFKRPEESLLTAFDHLGLLCFTALLLNDKSLIFKKIAKSYIQKKKSRKNTIL